MHLPHGKHCQINSKLIALQIIMPASCLQIGLIACLFLFHVPMVAAEALHPRVYETRSKNGAFVIKMTSPSSDGSGGGGVVYSVDGSSKIQLWSVNWFADHVALSDTGKDLVRYGAWSQDPEPWTEYAVAFYHEGKLLKKHLIKELIKDPSQISTTCGLYDWFCMTSTKPVGFSDDGKTYHLVFADKMAYDFDLRTGLILQSGLDTRAISPQDIQDADRKQNQDEATAIYKRSPLAALYQPHFKVEDMFYSADTRDSVWGAKLTPLKPLAGPVDILLCFPLRQDRSIASMILPTDFIEAASKATRHPWISSHLTANPQATLSLFSDGKGLNDLSWLLPSLLVKLNITDSTLTDPADWARFLLRTDSAISFWLHLKQGWVIYEEGGVYLLNAQGHSTKMVAPTPIERFKDPFDEP
ncbi:MAG: hypothetical protein V4672_11865 [Verrucomicrobiota bacterium]